MDLNNFLGFGQGSRPDIGLIADGIQNLAEIYESDKEFALRNIGLSPEILNIIYELSDVISREDLRSASGLSSLLLPTLDMQDEVFVDRLPEILEVDQVYSSSRYQLGRDEDNPSLSGTSVKLPNVLIYNGSIQCEGVEYRTNLIGERLYSSPDRKYTSVSTSRASLFNSQGWPADSPNLGYFKNTSLSGSIRVRKKSHVNRIIVPKTSYIVRADITENPSHEIICNITNGVGTSTKKMKLLATKNSPIRLLCRMAKGEINLTFTDANIYFYGFQIQPAQGRSIGVTPAFLNVQAVPQLTESLTHKIPIDIESTGYQNSYDLYLYLYVNPEKIKEISFSGIDIKDGIDGKDIGLIGFNNLESLTLSGTSIKILPIWLKTLKSKLKVLDLSTDKDTYRSGPLGWFDIRQTNAVPSASHPFYTVVSYLTVPKIGPMINENGDDWADPLFEKYVLNQARVADTDFRVFSTLETLNIKDLFYGRNPRFDDVFPALKKLYWIGETGGGNGPARRRIFGKPPKLNNLGAGKQIEYDISRSQASGSIYDIGLSNDVTSAGHISKYEMEVIKLNGDYLDYMEITGGIALDVDETNNSSEWDAWLKRSVTININYTRVEINLQPDSGTWDQLANLDSSYSGGIEFKTPSAPIKAPKLRSFSTYGTANSTGELPSLGDNAALHTAELTFVSFGGSNTISTISQSSQEGNTYQFILPGNFAPFRGSNRHLLESFEMNDSGKSGRLRAKDFDNLHELTSINFQRSGGIRCRFPLVPSKYRPDEETKLITVTASEGCNFYDLSSLDITDSNTYTARDLYSLSAWGNCSSTGCRLPSLVGTSGTTATKIAYIHLGSSNRSTYPSGWFDSSKVGAYIFDSDPPSKVDGLTPGKDIFSHLEGQWIDRDDIYYLTGTSLTRKVLSGDKIRLSNSSGDDVIANVFDVTSTRIVVDADLTSYTNSTYYFYRSTQPIDTWFSKGFDDLTRLTLSNCRLSGTIDIRSGFGKLKDGDYSCLDLSQNVLSGYTAGLTRVFTGASRKITIDFSSNNFSTGVIRTMLQELITIDKLKKYTSVTVRLNNCKLTSSNKYTEYTQEEIFPTSIEPAPSQNTSLFRNEVIKIYRDVPSLDENGQPRLDGSGNPITVKTQTGTKTVSVKGSYIASKSNGIAYNTADGSAPVWASLSNGRQRIVESTLGVAYKTMTYFKVNLGFTYKAPNTTPTTTNSEYGGQSTRRSTIEQAGYSWSDVVV